MTMFVVALNEILPLLKSKNIKLFQFGNSKTNIDGSIKMDLQSESEHFDIVSTGFADTLLYVHTSGNAI